MPTLERFACPGICRLSAAAALAVLVAGAQLCEAATIDRVEPPFWWAGFENRELQLMVYGRGIAAFTPSLEHEHAGISRVERGDSANYLFVYIDVGDTPPGDLDIVFTSGDETLTHRYRLEARDRAPRRIGGLSTEDVIYLVTPDRFANGEPSNDSVPGYGDPPDRNDPYGRHGGDLQGLLEHLDYIDALGVTRLWLNPVLENAMPKASYHGYATTNFYLVDPRFGTNEQYRALVTEARQRGIGVIMDVIVNHIGSAHPWMDDLPTADWINLPQAYTNHARTTNQGPYASEYDRRLMEDGWFVATMPDLNQRQPLLGDYLAQNAIFWIEYLGLAGLRVDTWPYPDKHYMADWTRRILAEYPELGIVGEEWSDNPVITSYWQAGKVNHDGYVSYLPSVFDFPLQVALAKALTAPEPDWGSVWMPVYELLATDFLYPDPTMIVTFPDNHDMSRIYTQLGEDNGLYRMALAFYMTMRGIPQIYYGTEILMSHPGTDSHGAIRSDFPGGWPGDEKNAFTGAGLDESERSALSFVRRLLEWRATADVVHHGRLMQFVPDGSTYVYFRYDDDDTLMVVLNRGDDTATLDMARFAERLGDSVAGVDVLSGRRYSVGRELVVAPREVLLLELER